MHCIFELEANVFIKWLQFNKCVYFEYSKEKLDLSKLSLLAQFISCFKYTATQ